MGELSDVVGGADHGAGLDARNGREFRGPASRVSAATELCRDRFEQFGTAGNASRINVVPLSEMARRYRSGALDPQIGKITAAA